jgi:hypothetical protein
MPTIALTPWPTAWTQLNDPTWDGMPDENAALDCGPESVSAALYYLTGVNIPADSIKDATYGQGYTGYTDFGHMQSFLQERCTIPSGLLLATPVVLAQHIRSWLDSGHPAVVLFWSDIARRSGGHFSPVFAYTSDSSGALTGLVRHNVWGGIVETFTLSQWNAAVQINDQGIGGALALNRRRSILA